jgi:predicted ester cyclase
MAEGEKVVTHYRVSGTHQGQFFGVRATDERITMSAISIDRFEGDKLVEEWPEYDLLGVMRQIGAVPAPG